MASSNFVNGNDVATFVLETDAPYNILDFDQGLCTMTGYSPRELSKKICTLDNLLYVEDFRSDRLHELSVKYLESDQYPASDRDEERYGAYGSLQWTGIFFERWS